MTRPARRLVRTTMSKLLVVMAVVAFVPLFGADPASADAYGHLQGHLWRYCLANRDGNISAEWCDVTDGRQDWGLEIVAYVNGDPRYRVRHLESNRCLVGPASGPVRMSGCASQYADQVWGFQYQYSHPVDHLPYYWLRNKATGKCLVMNFSRATQVFMFPCADYKDQYFLAPGST